MKLQDIQMRDPFVLVEGDTYYLYGTDENVWREGYKFDCYKSKDLEEFEGPIRIFEKTPDFWADRNYWAPEVHKYNGKFYLFASLKAEGVCRGTQIFVCDTPDGRFVPVSDGPVTPRDWECLDGTFYVENGEPYIVFSHEWVQIFDGEICAMRLSHDLTRAVEEPRTILKASEAPWTTPREHKSYPGKEIYVTDGPFLHTLSDGRLDLVWSSFHEGDYAIGQCISENGIKGPFVHKEEPIFGKDGGHGMVFRTKEGKLMLTIHMPNHTPDERPVFFPLTETREGLKRV